MTASAHTAECTCVRCRGFDGTDLGGRFETGNGVAVKHAATSMIRLAPRAAEIADDVRAIVPVSSEADEPTIRLLSLVLARIETANEWLAEAGMFRNAEGEPQPILKSLSTWENQAARLLASLGCTPTSRAALGVDIVRAAVVREQVLAGLEGDGRRLLAAMDGDA